MEGFEYPFFKETRRRMCQSWPSGVDDPGKFIDMGPLCADGKLFVACADWHQRRINGLRAALALAAVKARPVRQTLIRAKIAFYAARVRETAHAGIWEAEKQYDQKIPTGHLLGISRAYRVIAYRVSNADRASDGLPDMDFSGEG